MVRRQHVHGCRHLVFESTLITKLSPPETDSTQSLDASNPCSKHHPTDLVTP
jgi:hypothetical protein